MDPIITAGIDFIAACPVCGQDATWLAEAVKLPDNPRSIPRFEIPCAHCAPILNPRSTDGTERPRRSAPGH